MKTQITPRDWETLSAYLDDQLSAPDRREIENSLVNNPELRQSLEELRQTRMILRSLPKLRAPRNFTLTASMAGQRAGQGDRVSYGMYPVMRLAATLAAVFFFIVTAGGLALRFSLPAQTVVIRSAESQNVQAPAPFGMGGGGGGSNAAPPMAPIPAPTDAAVANTREKAPAQTGVAELQVTPLAPATPENTPDESQPGAMPKAFSSTRGSPEAQPQVAQVPQTLVQQPPATSSQPVGGKVWVLLTLVQILLAVLALVSAAAALVFRRTDRR
jgi:anti-sigma factor RsiW